MKEKEISEIKRMRKQHILYIATIVFILNIVFIKNNTYSLSYEGSIGIGFTFNPTISVSLNSSDLVISNLIPGSTANSNSINISVATNASYGYTLSVNASSDYLTHSNNTNTFSSIAIDADLQNLTTDNTWGYSTKLPDEANWNNYNGLSSSTNTTLIDNSNTADSTGSIDFKIGAKASSTQASGTYTNTITFTAVTKPTPMNLAESYFAAGKSRYKGYYTMQDMTTEICNNTEVIGEGSQTQLIDIRDDKVYWATKLADNHCWMTQNLDLDLSHNILLTSETTDLNSSSGAYKTNYTYDSINNIITWTPNNTTYNYTNKTGTPWQNNTNIAYSLNPGEWYWNGNYNAPACDYLTTTCEDFSQSPYSNNTHSAIGNYYNWAAAVASDNSNLLNTSGANATNSICSKNWRLPNKLNDEFKTINDLYSKSTSNDDKLIADPLWFVRGGYIRNGTLGSSTTGGGYWTSTLSSGNYPYRLAFDQNSVSPTASNGGKTLGFSVRCLAK